MNITLACQIMGISTESSQEDIKKKYKQLVLMYHPDRNKNSNATKKFIEMVEAYKFLRATPTERTKTKFVDPYKNTDWQQFFRARSRNTSTQQSNTWNFTFG